MARLKGKVDTAGTPQAGVTVHAFPTRKWGKPYTTTSDANGEWQIGGLYDELHDVVYIHPDQFWEGKVSSRRMPEFDPFDDPHWDSVVLYTRFEPDAVPFVEHSKFPPSIKTTSFSVDTRPQYQLFEPHVGRFGGGTGGAAITTVDFSDTVQPLYDTWNPFDFGATDWTVELWFNRNFASTGFGCLFNLGRSGNSNGLFIDSTYQLVWAHSGNRIVHQTKIVDNVWNHVVVMKKNGVLYIWLNGVRATQTWNWIWNSPHGDYASKFFMGSTESATFPFGGTMAEVRVTRLARYEVNDPILVPTSYMVRGVSKRSMTASKNESWKALATRAAWATNAGTGNFTGNIGSGRAFIVAPSSRDTEMVEITATISKFAGLVFRGQGGRAVDPPGNHYFFAFSDSGAPTVNVARLWKQINSVYTPLTDDIPISIDRGTPTRIKMQGVGTQLKAFINDAEILSVEDNSISSGVHGVTVEATGQGAGQIEFSKLAWGDA